MLVKDIMKKAVHTLMSNHTILDAIQLLELHHIRHIPIVNEQQHVIGIISDRDVRDARPSIFDENNNEILATPIHKIMSTPVITAHANDFFEEVASIFYKKSFACVPVIKNNQLVGIVTEKDMLHTFIQLTGTDSPSTQIEIKVPDQIGVLSEVCHYFTKRNIKIVSVYNYPDPKDSSYNILVFRIQTMNPMPVIEDFKDSEYQILYPYWED